MNDTTHKVHVSDGGYYRLLGCQTGEQFTYDAQEPELGPGECPDCGKQFVVRTTHVVEEV